MACRDMVKIGNKISGGVSVMTMPPWPGNKALLRPYSGIMVVNSPLISPYFLGGVALGGWAP